MTDRPTHDGGPPVSLIWAQTTSGVIGDGGSIPWHLPEDLAHFRELTTGTTSTTSPTVVMGRKTWDSLPDRFRPLPGRTNVVVTRQQDWSAEGAERAGSVDEALHRSTDRSTARGTDSTEGPLWVIGGGELYRQALPFADRIEITEVDLDVAGDTRAPDIDAETAGWSQIVTPESGWLESKTGIRYRFVSLTKDRAQS